ncbi:MAG TPA: Fe-S cluster assembly protein SufD [Povalibacter sp.]|nr:Fe-S cluster assembly protein SufD [Povalibacter sp.]
MSAIATKTAATAQDRYRAAFEARTQDGGPLTELRRAAFDSFAAVGFPTQRDEDWKYTNLRRLESRSFAPAEAAPVAADESGWIAGAGVRMVLVNGHAMPGLSSASPLPPGVTVAAVGQWIANDPAAIAAYIEQHAPARPSVFEHLSTAFFEDGVIVDIAADTVFDEPIYIVHQWAGSAAAMSHPRVIVRAGRNSRCTLIEHYLGSGDAESLTNTVVSLHLDAGAQVAHYRLQQESSRSFHVGTVRARLERDSRYTCHDIAFGASLARTGLTAKLEGPGAEAILRGLFVPSGSQHLDTYTLVEHVAPRTVSSEEYRGIADGRGRGVFRGKVIVSQDAQKIDSRQSSRNLLLSGTAEIDTRPELEIYADDVKCSHGATTGQLDTTSLFYLRSRGLSEQEARALLIRAFAESILTTIECTPVRNYLEQRLHERFAGDGILP